MSAYPYSRMPSAPAQASNPRRHPFGNALNQQQVPQAVLPKILEKPKQTPPDPPLPRQNSKTAPPSPPKIITDQDKLVEFHRVGFLGEGGFARVYEVKDVRGTRLACKVVTKTSLKTKKAKTKLYAEIKIHRSLSHPNIVRFKDCFEDENNVYMTLELCHSGSLMDMLRRRRRFTEFEARFFLVQLIGACHYMHTHQVIHRDLKLGNLFLDSGMNIKVGDFGLAALIENPGERKKTICGTPNYIAPEVLFDTANGHSFEVDTWSIGVILYTLVIGRPPFQTKDVKDIYTRIRDNVYEFPPDRAISTDCREIIQHILTSNPQQRPTLLEIVGSSFIEFGIVPGFIPMSAHDVVPDFRYITRPMSVMNLAKIKKAAWLDDDQVTSIAVPSAPQDSAMNESTNKPKNPVTSSIAQQEKEFQKAVQPGSPISALLSSARQPLVMSTNGTKESPLFRKLQTARDTKSPLRNVRTMRGLQDIEEEGGVHKGAREKNEDQQRQKELESQKARIVAQMAPASASHPHEDQENVPPVKRESKGKEKARESRKEAPAVDVHMESPSPKLNGFEAAAHTLTLAFEAKSAGRLFRDPREDATLVDEKVFIVSWVDYCNKYGMGYALTDGSVGVHFNDSTTLILSADKHHFDYISSRKHGAVYVRKNYSVSEFPDDLKNKVYLLKHFERYIMDRLYGDYEYTFEDVNRTKGMDFVQKYLRMKHVIVFKMSHDVLQFNFYDHTKVILSSQGLLVTHIDKNYRISRYSLTEIMAQALRPPVSDPEQAKFNQRLIDKIKYCKEVLVSIKNASGTQGSSLAGSDEDAGTIGAGMGLGSRSSKMSLR
ncbi:kinase-like domain-containing protein [Hygrophoropsis aurantiaca]|uniref:Kinase-like domain-containing protein n=1 Tax=Hygrophoropsis aurantiaca TaxID=72124 RepID=A0ACB8AIA2_9AGAM|nr:kinase-like domain-containing protein [Hygrophoropsis aurantiaca]